MLKKRINVQKDELEFNPKTMSIVRDFSNIPLHMDGKLLPDGYVYSMPGNVIIPRQLRELFLVSLESDDLEATKKIIDFVSNSNRGIKYGFGGTVDGDNDPKDPKWIKSYPFWFKHYTPEGKAGMPPAYVDDNTQNYDYDYYGYWLDNIMQYNPGFDETITFEDLQSRMTNNGHFPDTYKLPNHPTFSNESMYADTSSISAGKWVDYGYRDDGVPLYAFIPSDDQINKFGKPFYQQYQKRTGDVIQLEQDQFEFRTKEDVLKDIDLDMYKFFNSLKKPL